MPVLGILASSRLQVVPGPVAGYQLWLDAADTSTVIASGSSVTQWNDKSANGYNFSQATGASQPQTGTRTINSKNVIDFDGTNDFLDASGTTAAFDYLHNGSATIFIVGLTDTLSTPDTVQTLFGNFGTLSQNGINQRIQDSGGDLCIIGRSVSGTSAVNSSNNITYTASTAFYNTIKLDTTNATAANRYKINLNGGAFQGANAVNNATNGGSAQYDMEIGVVASGAIPFNGVLAEIIIYDSILSTEDITANEDYLSTKWGL